MNPPQLTDLEPIFANIVSVAVTFVGFAFLAMLLVGGFQFLSSGGDKESTQKAQKTITYALGGIVLAVSAWVILRLLGSFFGLPDLFSQFSILAPAP